MEAAPRRPPTTIGKSHSGVEELRSRGVDGTMKIDQYIAAGLGVALITGFILWERPHPKTHGVATAEPASAQKVLTAKAEKREIQVFADGVGTVRSRRQTQIAPRVLAEVREIRKGPGDSVEAGDVLIVLDSLDLQARVAQADATLRSVEEMLKEAQTEFDRKKNLLEKGAATPQEFDMARFGLSATEARREAAQKGLEEAKVQLGYTTIVAPFKGVVYEKHADPGDLANPGKPLLGIYDPEALRLEVLVDEALLWKLKVKDELQVKIDVLAEPLRGRVSEAVPAVDPTTRTGTVKIDLPPKLDLKPGLFGRARIPVSRREAILVPPGAIVKRGQLELAFTALPGEKEGTRRAHMVLVRRGPPLEAGSLGDGESRLVEVSSGLDAGAEVVVSGAEDLRDRDPIELEGSR
jgi:RND family efflux transporter MFP subunit